MNNQSTIFSVSPEDLVLRLKTGDSEAAFLMGLLCLSGLGVKQNLDQAGGYFAKAKQLGNENADVFMAYIHECNDRMVKAVDTYVGKGTSSKIDSNTSIISQRFNKVKSERNRLLKFLRQYGLLDCPLNTSLNSLLDDLDQGRRSLSDVCSIIALSEVNEHWCHDTAGLLCEEGDKGLAKMWLKKCHLDSEDALLKQLNDNSKGSKRNELIPIEIKGSSLLDAGVAIKILPEKLFESNGIKNALADWSRECNRKKQDLIDEQRRLEEEAKRKAEEARRKAEEERRRAEEERIRKEAEERRKAEEAKRKAEEAKRKAEEERIKKEAEERKKAEEAKRKAEEEARRRAEERSFIVGRYGRQRDEIVDKTVSRQHCRVTVLDDNTVEIENLSQSNGTVINGERIERAKVSMESIIKMGNYVVKVRDLFPPRQSINELDKQRTQ